MNDRIWMLVPEKRTKETTTRALEHGFTTFVCLGSTEDVADLARVRVLRLTDDGIHEGERLIAPRVAIHSPKDQASALEMAGKHEAVLVDAQDWKIIPHENLIAAYRRKGTRLLARARDVEEAKLMLETLEKGVDVVLLPVEQAESAAKTLGGLAGGAETLVAVRITRIRTVGLGDRACLDTASMLREDEGVLTGNSSSALLLVASEARDSGYVAARPFRVNAGAVHSYVVVPGGATRYLSELRAGDEILTVDAQGRTRAVTLGRVKIERRPLLLIEFEGPHGAASALVQNAETIRLVGPRGTLSVVELREGDEVLARVEAGGRHFGMSIDETILER